RDRIHFRGRNSGDEIRRARPARGNCHADLAVRTRMTFRSKHRALLVTRQNVPDAAALERVIQRHDRAARIAEHEFDAFSSQALQKYFRTFKHSQPFSAEQFQSSVPACPISTSSSWRAGLLPLLLP